MEIHSTTSLASASSSCMITQSEACADSAKKLTQDSGSIGKVEVAETLTYQIERMQQAVMRNILEGKGFYVMLNVAVMTENDTPQNL